MKIPDVDIEAPDTLLDLSNWKLVVIFYTLRLMLAPIVESVILYDRVLCLLEHGNYSDQVIQAIYNKTIYFSFHSRLQDANRCNIRPGPISKKPYNYRDQTLTSVRPNILVPNIES